MIEGIPLQLLIALLGIGGAAAGAWVAVKSTVAVLESRVARAEEEIKSLRDSRHHTADVIQALQLDVLRMKK